MKNAIEVDSVPNQSAEPEARALQSNDAPSLHLLGIPFHRLNIDQVLARITSFISAGEVSRQICLSNAYTVSLCWKDAELRRVFDRADLVLADGMSIVWGGRMIGINLPERVAGPDLFESLCALAERMGYRLYFLGSTLNNLAQLKEVLLRKWPRLQIAGTHSPPMCETLGPEENRIIFEELRVAKPDILFVGMSSPKQEKWIASNLKNLEVPVSIGIGAAFDFMSGRMPRAPLFFQESGLEWLYRLYREPRRLWKRYLLGNFIFLSHLGAAWIRFRFRSVK
jgi:N-acetylglucosaminyldiphosphoundecaprenol N-acetyl-beta-D-mannosaminyltransferase